MVTGRSVIRAVRICTVARPLGSVVTVSLCFTILVRIGGGVGDSGGVTVRVVCAAGRGAATVGVTCAAGTISGMSYWTVRSACTGVPSGSLTCR